MKKGVQYSHYCGTELLEIICGIRLCMEFANEDKTEAEKWGKYALEMTDNLRKKISDLDTLNEMEF